MEKRCKGLLYVGFYETAIGAKATDATFAKVDAGKSGEKILKQSLE